MRRTSIVDAQVSLLARLPARGARCWQGKVDGWRLYTIQEIRFGTRKGTRTDGRTDGRGRLYIIRAENKAERRGIDRDGEPAKASVAVLCH